MPDKKPTILLTFIQAHDAKRAILAKLDRGQFDSGLWLAVIKALELSGFASMAWDLRSRHDHYMAVLSG